VDFSFVCLGDLADVAAKVLREGEWVHGGASYELVSVGRMTYRGAVEIVAGVVGEGVDVRRVDYGEAVERMAKVMNGGEEDVDGMVRDGVERIVLYYNRRGLRGNSNVLEWLLGRKATTVEEWAERKLAETELAETE